MYFIPGVKLFKRKKSVPKQKFGLIFENAKRFKEGGVLGGWVSRPGWVGIFWVPPPSLSTALVVFTLF